MLEQVIKDVVITAINAKMVKPEQAVALLNYLKVNMTKVLPIHLEARMILKFSLGDWVE